MFTKNKNDLWNISMHFFVFFLHNYVFLTEKNRSRFSSEKSGFKIIPQNPKHYLQYLLTF